MSDSLKVLKQVRGQKTQREVADILGVDAKTISRWENGHTPVPPMVGLALKDFKAPTTKKVKKSNNHFTFIDLFAGIGGIRTAFEEQGGKCVFTSEWDSYAQTTYAANFGDKHAINGDITEVDAIDIPKHDVLLAGFPCQPFSIAGVSKKNALGKSHGFQDETQGTLFFDIARIIHKKKPKAFLLENVKNLLSHDKGQTFDVIKRTLETELGYQIKLIEYHQPVRKFGVSKMNMLSLYDIAITGIVKHSKLPLRIMTILGFVASFFSLIISLGYLIYKILFWNTFVAGVAPLVVGLFALGFLNIFILGLIGEYVLGILIHVRNIPHVFEKERINF